MDLNDTTIVIPYKDEDKNIFELIDNLNKLRYIANGFKVIIVADDKQFDSELYQAGYYISNVQFFYINNTGMGKALLFGTNKVTTKYVVWTMADCSDRLTDIPWMIKELRHGADLVIGSRNVNGGSHGNRNWFKTFLSISCSFVYRNLFHIPVKDVTNAFRAFRKDIIKDMKLSESFDISPELTILANKKGFKISEIPTVYSERKHGKSYFTIKEAIKYFKILRYFFQR